jgi:hypothetical protein
LSTAPADIVLKLDSLPDGSFRGTSCGKHYIVSKSTHADGRAIKLVAEELGGPAALSLNVYLLGRGARLYPCETTVARVVGFLRALSRDAESSGPLEASGADASVEAG